MKWRMKYSACDRFVRSDGLVARRLGWYQWIRWKSIDWRSVRLAPRAADTLIFGTYAADLPEINLTGEINLKRCAAMRHLWPAVPPALPPISNHNAGARPHPGTPDKHRSRRRKDPRPAQPVHSVRP
jgi:hypothetical protein